MTRTLIALRTLVALFFLSLSAVAAAEKAPVYTALFSKTALKGYDAVAYFEAGEPRKGDDDFAYDWNGARWLFESAANRDAFFANPERFAPQYGGYCAWAVSQGYTASGDPKVWAVVDDKLYINYNKDIGARWQKDPAGFIKLANDNWPKVLED